jgi:hypothetical protein
MPNSKPEEFKLGHYLSFRFFGGPLRLIGGYLRGLEDDKGETTIAKRGEKRGEKMVKSGENVVANVGSRRTEVVGGH